jgi:hypothetical protein
VTGGEFSGVDIDLLADYVGGALDGTPDEAVVAALVAGDPAWADAHDALTGGIESVRADLRALGAEPEPMPDHLAVRISAALAELPPLTGPDLSGDTDHDLAKDAKAREPAGVRRHLAAVPDESDGAGVVRGQRDRGSAAGRRRRLRQWAAPIAVAAGALVFAGVGLGELLSGGSAEDSGSTTAGQAAPEMNSPLSGGRRAADAATLAEAGQVTASGLDYGRATLARGNFSAFSSEVQKAPSIRPGPARVSEAADAIPALDRLRVQEALLACIDAIRAEHRSGDVTPDTIDYARFEGAPALVVRFTASDGAWAWVSGPDCGAPGAGADTRYSVQVR